MQWRNTRWRRERKKIDREIGEKTRNTKREGKEEGKEEGEVCCFPWLWRQNNILCRINKAYFIVPGEESFTLWILWITVTVTAFCQPCCSIKCGCGWMWDLGGALHTRKGFHQGKRHSKNVSTSKCGKCKYSRSRHFLSKTILHSQGLGGGGGGGGILPL